MYVCSFISWSQKHKPKHKNTVKAVKKKIIKNDHANNTLYKYNKCQCNLHAHYISKQLKHKQKKKRNNRNWHLRLMIFTQNHIQR